MHNYSPLHHHSKKKNIKAVISYCGQGKYDFSMGTAGRFVLILSHIFLRQLSGLSISTSSNLFRYCYSLSIPSAWYT